MASRLTTDEVAHIAELARLDLSPAEREMFAQQLTDILAYAATVQQADTASVADAATAEPRNARLRESSGGHAGTSERRNPGGPELWRHDTPVPGLARDEVLAEAPDGVRDAGLFRVPKVL